MAIPTRDEVFGRAAARAPWPQIPADAPVPLSPGRFDTDDGRRMAPQPLTRVQGNVLRFIALHILHWQRPPCLRLIAAEFGWSSMNAAYGHLQALERRGWIALDLESAGGRGKSHARVLHWPEGLDA